MPARKAQATVYLTSDGKKPKGKTVRAQMDVAFQSVMFYSSAPKVCSLCKAKVPAWTLHQCSTGTPRRRKQRAESR